MLELLKKLCSLDGISGTEDEVRDYIKSLVEPYADELRIDPIGNLLVFKKGRVESGTTMLVAAHMDEVGFIIKSVTDEGYLKIDAVGGIDRRVVIGKKLRVGRGKIPGVIGIKPFHLVSEDESSKVPKFEDLYVDIGAKGKEDALKLAEIGDTCAFDVEPEEFGDGYFKAKAIDDRAGCAALIKIIQEGPEIDTWFAFTAQEEVGTRGAFGAAFSIKPDIAIVVEGTTAADVPGVEDNRKICAPGKGVVIPFMDGRTIYDREIFEILRETAVEKEIPWQTKSVVSGGTDASAIQRMGEGARVGGIAVAVRYIHAPSSVIKVSDLNALHELLREFLRYFGGNEND